MIDLLNVSNNPGCYIFKDSKNNIIYIGKAKDLKKRVGSYFHKKHDDKKTLMLVSQIRDVEFIVTDTEAEALILENNLIKKHTPKYNIDLKDSKRYAYLKIADEDFPRLMIARQRKDKGNYYGPFVSAQNRSLVKELLVKNFKLRTCKRFLKKECLRYHIGLCNAPCAQKISKEEYHEKIKAVEMVLAGKITETVRVLKDKMDQYSKNKEKAQEV